MTVIVGIVEDGIVYMGGDSCTAYGSMRMHMKRDKVIRRGEFVFGSAGYTRIVQIVGYDFTPPQLTEGQDEYQYMITTFVPELRKAIKDAGQLEILHGKEDMYNDLLVGFRGRLFELSADFCVDELIGEQYAIGSGARFALGALHAVKDQKLKPEDRIKVALKAAADLDLYVYEPFVIEKVGE